MRDKVALKFIVYICIFFFAGVFFLQGNNAYCLELQSTAFREGEDIPIRYTGKGEDISPALSWSDVPAGTKSFILIMEDPDAPMGTWIHWVIYGIPGTSRGLREAVPKQMILDDGTKQGINSFRWVGYGGPHPPPGPAHRYFFRLYALDTDLDVLPGAPKGAVMRKAQGHLLDNATLMGKFAS